MENNKIVTILAVLIIGLGAGYFWGLNNIQTPQVNMHIMPDGTMMDDTGMTMGSAMSDMMAGLSGKVGDEFDKSFLIEMIMHHEGAVVMAEAALRDAKHQEIKNMANDIISAQNGEITQMKNWLRDWYNQ